MREAFIYDGVRTPFGHYGKSLAASRPDDLLAGVFTAILERNPSLDPASLGDVIAGNANGAGEENRNVARMSSLLAGIPTSVPGVTVNRLCGSSMEAVIQARRAIACGEAETVLVGGVESMSRAPWVVPKPERAFPAAASEMYSTTLGWRMVNPSMPSKWAISLGGSAEKLADIYGISREAQDAFAAQSHHRAAAAWQDGIYAAQTVAAAGATLARDEAIRDDTSAEALAGLRPAFRQDGTVTAGNSSPLSDGASALLVGAEGTVDAEPLARIVSTASTGNDPDVFGIAPVDAMELAVERAGISWGDVVQVEINEAFASQVLACLSLMPHVDPGLVNPHGGAIAIGHPLGASGGRLISHLAHSLRARGGGYGVAGICIGVGQALAVVLEG